MEELHRDVVLELAHQQRGLLEGQLVFAAVYIPFYLDLTHNQGLVFHVLFTGFCVLLLVVGGVFWIRAHRRLTGLLATDRDRAAA